MRRRRQTPQKNQGGNLGHGFRIPSSTGTYEDADPKVASKKNSDPTWYSDEPGTMLMTVVPLDLSPVKTNEYPRAIEHTWAGDPQAQFPKETFVIWLGMERVVENLGGTRIPSERRVLKPVYLMGSSRVIIDPKFLTVPSE